MQYFLHFAKAHQLRDDFFDQLWMRIIKTIDQSLGLLTSQKLIRVAFDEFREMRGEDRGCIHNGISGCDGLGLQLFCNPLGGDAKCRLTGLFAGQVGRRGIGAYREQQAPAQLPARYLHSAQVHDIFPIAQGEIVRDVDGRNEEPELLRQALAQCLERA